MATQNYRWRLDQGAQNAYFWTDTWVDITPFPGNAYNNFTNQFFEVRLLRTYLGSPSEVSVHMSIVDETAMSEIQKGFLYDNVNVVKNGVKHLKVTIAHTESFIKEGVGENKINNKVYAKKVADQIDTMADEILTTFKKGDRYSAANNYLLILSKCLSCHQTVRSW